MSEKLRTMKTTNTRDNAKKRQEQAALVEKNDWEWLTSDERGLRVVYRTLQICGVFRSGFNPNALTMSFTEGQRNIGLYLWDRMARHVPEAIPTILNMRDSDA